MSNVVDMINHLDIEQKTQFESLRKSGSDGGGGMDSRISKLEKDVAVIASNYATGESIAGLRTEIHGDIANLRTEIHSMKAELIKWMSGLTFTAIGIMVAILLAFMKILPLVE